MVPTPSPSQVPTEESDGGRSAIIWAVFCGLVFIALCACLVSAALKWRRHHPPKPTARNVVETHGQQPTNLLVVDERGPEQEPSDVTNGELHPLEPDLPSELHVKSPNKQRACAGIYDLVPERCAHGRPVWHKRDDQTPRWLFTGNDGRWYVGGPVSEQQGFDCNSGYICHTALDCSRPDLVDGPWLWLDSADWYPDSAIIIQPTGKGELRDGRGGIDVTVIDTPFDNQDGLRNTSQATEAGMVSITPRPVYDDVEHVDGFAYRCCFCSCHECSYAAKSGAGRQS